MQGHTVPKLTTAPTAAVRTLTLALLAGLAPAQEQAVHDIWLDPVFQRQFIGSYGINAEVEPRISPEELALLAKLRPVMAESPWQAEELLAKQMKPDGSAILDFTLAGLRAQQDKFAEALTSYQRAVEKFPSFRRSWRNLGLLHVRLGNYDEGIKAFVRMIELGGADGYAYGLMGMAYAAKQDFQPAEASFRNALLLQPDNNEWRLGLTNCVYKQEKFADAASLLDALLARYPENDKFWMLQAHTFVGLKQPLRAAANLEVVDRLGKSTVDSLHTLGALYLGENLPDLATRAYLKSLTVDADQALTRPLRTVELLIGRGDLAQARALAARIHQLRDARIDEADRRKLLKLDARLALAGGSGSPETVAVLEELVRIDPLDGDALLLLAQHHARSGATEQAMLYYERAAGIEACEVQARFRHAQLLVGQSRFADALPLLRRAQELRPREDLARFIEQVERNAKSRR